MAGVGTVTLTATGRAKLTRVLTVAREAAQAASAFAAIDLKAAVSAAAPSEDEEARMLSAGVGTAGGGLASFGTPEGGRFLREGAMVSMREAIARDPLVTVPGTPDRVGVGFGNATAINAQTGFSWKTRKRGVQGPTLPFNEAYVQALENGGVIWVVVPRPGTKMLEPEEGRFARTLYKTLIPRRMYRGTLTMRQVGLKARMAAKVRAAVRGVA
jgi:hypothetical protein